jgi:hypothetical protein
VVIVYSFGFGVPALLFFVMKFLGANNFSLPEVKFLLNLVDLHLWVLVCLLFGYFLAVYHSMGMVALDFDDLRNDQFNCFLGLKYDRVS